MKIESSAFQSNKKIPSLYTCDGEDISPELIFSDVPKDAQSLVLVVEDPDVPKIIREDGMWNHWLVWNMSPNLDGIGEGEIPQGIVGKNTKGDFRYGGPCPPDKEHRYFFKLYALDIILDLSENASKEKLQRVLGGHIIEEAELIGLYNRI